MTSRDQDPFNAPWFLIDGSGSMWRIPDFNLPLHIFGTQSQWTMREWLGLTWSTVTSSTYWHTQRLVTCLSYGCKNYMYKDIFWFNFELSQVTWDPYDGLEEADIQFSCTCFADDDLYTMTCPLICFYAVEYHLAHRVARQFGFRQEWPVRPLSTSVELHK